MKCNKCETEFDKGKFCPKCGEKYEENEVIEPQEIVVKHCSHCGNEMGLNAKFCRICGQAQDVEEKSPEPRNTNAKDKVDMLLNKIPLDKVDFSKLKEIKNKKVVVVGAVGALALLSAGIVGRTTIKNIGNQSLEKLVYQTDDGELYIQTSKEKFKEVTDDLSEYKYNDTLENIYVLTNDQELYYQYKQKDKVLLEKDVEHFIINETGEVVIYLDDYTWDSMEGTLKYHQMGKEAVVLSKESEAMVVISPNGEYVAYGERDGEHLFKIYLSKEGSKGVELADEVLSIIDVSDKGDVLYCDEDFSLIKMSSKGKEELVVKDIRNVQTSYDMKKIYAITEDGEMGVYENKRWTELQGKNANENSLHKIVNNQKEEYAMFYDTKGAQLVLPNNKLISIKDYKGSMSDFTADGKTFYYMENDLDLNVLSFNGDKIQFEERVAKNVVNFLIVPDSKDIYYVDTDGDLYLYNYKKESKKITKDIRDIVVDGKNNVYCVDEDFVLNKLDKKGKSTEILEDVAYAVRGADGSVYALLDDGELHVVLGNNKTTRIDKDVASVYSIGGSHTSKVYMENNSRHMRSYY